MRKADRLLLNDVIELDAPGRSITEQALIGRQMLARRDQQNVADPRKHQHRKRVVDHRLIVDREQLLVDGERRRVEPRARAAGKDDTLHAMALFGSKRSIVSASARRHGGGLIPNVRAAAVQSSLVSAARTAGLGYSIVGIGTICGAVPSRLAAVSMISLANSNQLASPAPAK